MTDFVRSKWGFLPGSALLLILLAGFSISIFGQPTQNAQPYFTEPAIAPDGSEIAFVSGGDIWTVPAAGGEARLLVSHPANESRPLYSPDGRHLAFISARTNLDQLLAYKITRRVVLSVAPSADGAQKREVVVRPVNGATERALLYRRWVEDNRAYVARISNGRLGYVHMLDMSAGALTQLSIDLDAENQKHDGVVIDMRNNNGGFVNVYAIDVFSRRSYFTMTPRGFSMSPSRTVLGQRALESPTILVTNRHTLSDGEDFTEGYRSLRLGKVVGEPTAGWIIYTSGVQLVDGSTLRLPFTRITANDGTVMELHPRPVDVPIAKPVGESYLGRDSQLEAAVKELLKQLGSQRP